MLAYINLLADVCTNLNSHGIELAKNKMSSEILILIVESLP